MQIRYTLGIGTCFLRKCEQNHDAERRVLKTIWYRYAVVQSVLNVEPVGHTSDRPAQQHISSVGAWTDPGGLEAGAGMSPEVELVLPVVQAGRKQLRHSMAAFGRLGEPHFLLWQTLPLSGFP